MVALSFVLAGRCFAQKTVHWRVFKVGDGSAAAVSVGPKGNVWVKNADSPEINWLDGYAAHRIPAPNADNYRVYESRSGQLWSLYPEGLLLYEYGEWARHPVNEIQGELRLNPLRQLRQISLLPAEVNHVFFLLSDRLMEYDAALKKARVLKLAGDTKLQRFSEMREARDGSVWISGRKGLANLPGPVRRLTANSPWQEFPVESEWPAENLLHPFEDAQGGITAVASDPISSGRRYVARFDGRSWKTLPIEGEKLRQAWQAWDQTVWAYTFNALLRLRHAAQPDFVKETALGVQYDVALESTGAFWLATSEGVIRYAPPLWRTPPALEEVQAPVHALLWQTEEDREHLWFASTDALVEFRDGQRRSFNWPEDFETDAPSTVGLYRLPDGQLAVAAAARPLLFDPATAQFRTVIHPGGRRVKFIGQFKNGTLCAKVSEAEDPNRYQLEIYDGRKFRLYLEPEAQWNLGSDLYFLTVTQNGDAWIGGSSGLGVFRAGDRQFQTFGPEQGYSLERALCLLDVGDGRIWCGGTDRILEFNGQKWKLVHSGFDRVSSMIKGRDGRIWVATGSGLFRFYNGSWVLNDTEEGLPSSVIYEVAEDARAQVWAGTSGGLSRYHPEADTDPPRTLAPVLENPRRRTGDDTTTIRFAGVDKWNYTPAAYLLFSYRLDDAPWSAYTHETVKTWPGLGSGKHRLEARAMDRNWNEDPKSTFIEFNVVVPWFKDPRLIGVSIVLLLIILFLAGLAVNRHIQLVHSYAAVEKIVAQRTQELEAAHQELLHSQKMRALGTLAAGIAHDFNNILSIIKGSIQIIEHNPGDNEKVRTRVDRIKTVVEQGTGIVRSMLGLGRMTEKELAALNLEDVVEETIKLLGDRFSQEIQFRLEKVSPLPPVFCSREMIQQMLVNLILNAVDAMSGGGNVILRTNVLSALPASLVLAPAPAPRHIALMVEDRGHGIPPEILPRIFEPFFTTKSLSTRRGTGLGLSMVYELAKGLGYGLAVESVVGRGSIFSIFIPVQD